MSHTISLRVVLVMSLLGLFCMSQPHAASAGINIWTSNGPGGGYIGALAIDPSTPGTLYAGTQGGGMFRSGGVFKSTDGGATWSAANDGLPMNAQVQTLAIDPATPRTLYAGTADGSVFRSTNGGATWSAAGRHSGVCPSLGD